MFTPLSRFILLLLCAIASIIGAFFQIWTILILSTIFSLMLLIGYFKSSTVSLAYGRLKRNKFEEANTLLDHVKIPDRLTSRNRTNYYFIKGMIARENDSFTEAKQFLDQALALGIKNENDRAMTLLALADMELINKNEEQAKTYFMQIKNLKVAPSLMPTIRKMQSWLAVH